MSSGEDVITQVAPPGAGASDLASVHELPETTMLNLRGRTFAVSRERLLSLPENILFGLTSGSAAYTIPADEQDVPTVDAQEEAVESAMAGQHEPPPSEDTKPDSSNPHIHQETEELPPIAPQSPDYASPAVNDSTDSVEEGETELETMSVDFNQDCFAYLLNTFDQCEKSVTPVPISSFKEFHGPHAAGDGDIDGDEVEPPITPEFFVSHPFDIPEVLRSRPSVIVLREDLEYYLLTEPGLPEREVIALKEQAGDLLAMEGTNRKVFSGLRNRDTLDSPEYHLMQMLVLAGLSTDQVWGFREHEPRQSRVLSLQLQPVKLPGDPSMIENVRALQKLLLFWRKPAKKCWWDKFDMVLGTKAAPTTIPMHARRVWTLELSILGLTS